MDNQENVKMYELKIPVYVSESAYTESNSLVNVTYGDMINLIKQRIDSHNISNKNITAQRRKKTKKKEINSLSYVERTFNSIPGLFIKINASNTNLYDTYIQADEIFELGKNDKIGSENNWLLLYPRIVGVDSNNYMCYWLIFVYADPHKDFDDITQSAKLFVKHILQLKLRNIKTQDILSELKGLGSTPEMRVKYTYIATDNGDVDVKYQDYVVSGNFKKEKQDVFANMPFNYSEEVINDVAYQQEYQKKEIKVIIGKKEYKIVKKEQLDEAKKLLEDFVEETFNMCSNITESELEPGRLYDLDFMESKLKPVIENYLASYA